jgi:glycosyltransferase involved in cell wall biosynthesis
VKILCLMPTYGRRAALLNNSLACFAAQTHPDKHLLIYDDLGTLSETKVDLPNVTILSTTTRSPSVGAKYNEMLAAYQGDYDAVAVWDDDDVELPEYLSAHTEILERHPWSKPSRIISAYFDPPMIESAHGRFHGSIAVRRDAVKMVPWIDTTRATFDQEYIAALSRFSPPGDPCSITSPQYVYRWQTSQAGHCSGLMGSPDWYRDYQPDSRQPIDRLWPELDPDTRRLFAYLIDA